MHEDSQRRSFAATWGSGNGGSSPFQVTSVKGLS